MGRGLTPAEWLYFAYGSNLNRAQMRRRCPGARPVLPAWLVGFRLTFRGRPPKSGVADVQPDPLGRVPGALWRIGVDDLAALDRYEGYPYLYGRRQVQVETAEGVHTALIYVMQPGFPPAPPHPRYYEVIRQGYADWGLDPAWLEAARRQVEQAAGPPFGPVAG